MAAVLGDRHAKPDDGADESATDQARLRLKKKMCSHVAWALLVHTVLLILLIGHGVSGASNAIVGHMILIAMLTLFILIARDFHYRWRRRAYIEKHGPAGETMIARFRRDLFILWTLALGLPFFWLILL